MNEESPVAQFVAALDQYRKARDEQHVHLATRPPDDMGEAEEGVKRTLRALLDDLG